MADYRKITSELKTIMNKAIEEIKASEEQKHQDRDIGAEKTPLSQVSMQLI